MGGIEGMVDCDGGFKWGRWGQTCLAHHGNKPRRNETSLLFPSGRPSFSLAIRTFLPFCSCSFLLVSKSEFLCVSGRHCAPRVGKGKPWAGIFDFAGLMGGLPNACQWSPGGRRIFMPGCKSDFAAEVRRH